MGANARYDSPAILMQGVTRDVEGHDDRSRVRILHGIDLAVPRGALLNIVGPSGSGKSSLIRLVNRLDEPSSGTIEVLGRPLRDWPPRDLRRRVGMAFQEPTLLEKTVRENLRLPFELCHESPGDIETRVEEALGDCGVPGELIDRDATQLSVGQKQRVALARALVGRPDVLLLDEPTSSLDPRTAEELLDRLTRVRERRELTMVMVTHRLDDARRVGGELAVVIEGRVAAMGPVERVVADPPTEAVRRFLHGDDDDAG